MARKRGGNTRNTRSRTRQLHRRVVVRRVATPARSSGRNAALSLATAPRRRALVAPQRVAQQAKRARTLTTRTAFHQARSQQQRGATPARRAHNPRPNLTDVANKRVLHDTKDRSEKPRRTCKPRPEKNTKRRGNGPSKAFVPWCDRK